MPRALAFPSSTGNLLADFDAFIQAAQLKFIESFNQLAVGSATQEKTFGQDIKRRLLKLGTTGGGDIILEDLKPVYISAIV